MKTFLRTLLALSLVLVFAAAAQAEQKTYINGIDLNFPPYGYVDKDGQPAGFDVESVNWIAEKMGFQVKHQPMDWAGIIPALTSGKIDLIASGMSATEERAKVVNFTIPYQSIKQVLVVKEGSDLSVEQAMKGGHKIGVQRGTTENTWFEEQNGKDGNDYEVVVYDSSPMAVQDLVNGRIDASAMDDSIAKDIAKAKPITIIGTYGMDSEDYAYAVRKEDKELLEMLNKGLEMLMADPHWDELKAKYEIN